MAKRGTNMTTNLRDNYRYYRARAYPAESALERARIDLTNGKKRYGACSRTINYERRNVEGLGFLANALGTLRITYCDEASSNDWRSHINHKGWFTDPYQEETIRGVIVQLSHNRYFPAYESSNDKAGLRVDWSDRHDDMRDAAYAADSLAEKHAEEEREYQTAWQAGSLFASLGEEITQKRQSILELCAEHRKARSMLGASELTAICATIKASVSRALREIARARAKREKLRSGDDDELCFYPSKELIAAFNDGASISDT